MARQRIDRLFLVERLCWTFGGMRVLGKVPDYLKRQVRPNPFTGKAYLTLHRKGQGAVPVKAFLDLGPAEQQCRRLNDEAWVGINPFHYGNKVGDWTSFDSGRLRDWMLDLGLEPPEGKITADKWRRWYDGVHDSLGAVRWRAIRQGLDRVQFYQLTELTE